MKRWIRGYFLAKPLPYVAPRRLNLVSLEDRTVPATFTVVNGNDAGAGSLRDAVNSANTMTGADTITFASGISTVALTSAELLLTDTAATTIDGGSGVTITRSGAVDFRLLHVAANAMSALNALTLTNGKTAGKGGAILVDVGATVTLTNATLSGNTANNGGGIYNRGTVTLTNATLTANRIVLANTGTGGFFGDSHCLRADPY